MNLILLQPGNPEIIFGGTRYPQPLAEGVDLSETATQYGIDLQHCLPLVSFNQGLKQQLADNTTNPLKSVAGITCTKYVDAYSVMFYDACMRGVKLGEGRERPTSIFMLGLIDSKVTTVLKLQLRDAVIGNIEMLGNTFTLPSDTFNLSFSEILWQSNILDNQGHVQGMLNIGWSILLNRPISSFSE
jgi:type VI secretion system secreted protein Hcp